MLSASLKLNSTQFTTVFETGRTIHSDYLTIKYLTGQSNFRAAATVSKKHTKTAVLRNYKRRMLYNIVKDIQTNTPALLENKHVIVILKKNALTVAGSDLRDQLQVMIEKIK